MLGLNMFEHVAGDRVDNLEVALAVYDMHHPGLKLVPFGALVVERMQVQREAARYGDGADSVSQCFPPEWVLLFPRLALVQYLRPRQALGGLARNRTL